MHAGDAQPQPPAQPDGVELAPNLRAPADALRFAFVRSTGPGGQNVNKRSTKAELRIAIGAIPLDAAALRRLRRLAGSRLVAGEDEGPELLITADEHRTQRRNRDACLERLRELLVRAMTPPKPRKKTRPSKGAMQRRLQEKTEHKQRKQRRRWNPE